MTIPELGAIDFSSEELKGFAIANALANQALAAQQLPTLTDAEYLSARVLDLARGYAAQHVAQAEDAIIVAALKGASAKDREAVAAALKVDIAIPVPAVALDADVVKA